MLVKVLTVKYVEGVDGFDDAALRSFCLNHTVIDIREEFFLFRGVPHWSFVIRYESTPAICEKKPETRKRDEDWREWISNEQMPCFEALREWRNDQAQQEGISAYIIATNRILAEIVRRRPTSLEALKEIRGFGPSKLKNYGKAILALLNTSPPQMSTPTEESADGSKLQ
ncbi:MAG: HRDC domain-containing protein [Planctomycetes bacterium]|nr:HRDC domain-containing protein [Planctomycetota bacterium]